MPSNQAEPVTELRLPPEHDQGRSGEAVASGSFHVDIRQHEGPLEALLDLVKKQRLDILDIPIAKVTEQYLESIRRAEALDFEIGAEFLLMAATLIHIKSKALLPTPPSIEEDAGEDPRRDLVQQLLERERFLKAAQVLQEKRLMEDSVWTVGARESHSAVDEDSEQLEVTLFELVRTFGDVLERLRNQPTVEMDRETVSVASRIRYLRNLLEGSEGPVPIRRILLNQQTARALVATFLALLEMVRAQAVELHQRETFGEIVIRKHVLFERTFQTGDPFPSPDSELGRLA
jgi:segregation and condensation protein A